MTDFSVRMQCQGQTDSAVRCSRRGRMRLGEDGWFCWQHSTWYARLALDKPSIAVFPPAVMPG